MLGRIQKRRRYVKIKMGVQKADALAYFDHKCSYVNSIWYPCCFSLEGKSLICGLLSRLTTLKINRKLNFRINDYSEFVIIVFQKRLSQPLLLSVITTLVNTKVHQLTDMTDPLSTPRELSPKRTNLLIKESLCSQ